jgi:hypothetical protein
VGELRDRGNAESNNCIAPTGPKSSTQFLYCHYEIVPGPKATVIRVRKLYSDLYRVTHDLRWINAVQRAFLDFHMRVLLTTYIEIKSFQIHALFV